MRDNGAARAIGASGRFIEGIEMALDEATIVAQIKSEITNAVSSGYEMLDWSMDDIAADLIAYSVTFEDWTIADLSPLVAKSFVNR